MRLLLLAAVASLSLLASGCCHWCKCQCQCVPAGSGSSVSGSVNGRETLVEPDPCASAAVATAKACLANAQNDVQKGGCCHQLGQVPGTAEQQEARRKCVPSCAP